MRNFRSQLASLKGYVCLMGLGNVELGDDGFGMELAEHLAWDEDLPHVLVIPAGTQPERCLAQYSGHNFDHLVFLDAVDFGGEPGAVTFLGSHEMATRFPQVSTHRLSLGLLAQCAEADGVRHAWLLGVQPESLKASRQLSPVVRRTMNLLAELLTEHFQAVAQV